MAAPNDTSPEALLHALIPRDELVAAARETGFLKRRRKIDTVAFFAAVVFGLSARGGQSISGCRRALALRAGISVVRSSFWARLCPAFERLTRWVLDRLIGCAESHPPAMTGALAPFTDVVAVDSSVVALHPALEDTWRGTRRSSAPAALKLHTRVRATTGELLRFRITEEAYGDPRAFGVTWCDKAKLFLFDRGYSSASLWSRVDNVGAFFVTRLPTGPKAVVVGLNRAHRGRARKLVGESLAEVVNRLHRDVIDVQCEFRVHVRGYGGRKGRNTTRSFRVVGIKNAKTRKHHLYVTNVPPEIMPAGLVAELYRLRWETETFYRVSKSGLGLNELPTTKPHIVRILLHAALIRASLAMVAKRRAAKALPVPRWINPLSWTSVFAAWLEEAAKAYVSKPHRRARTSWARLARLAADPNMGRPPTRLRLLGPSGGQPSGIMGTHA